MNANTVSYWNKTVQKKHYPRLEKGLETDILIIGSGITGITCAYCLAQKGAKPIIIEAGALCDGTTGNTTGKVTIQHNIIYSHILEKHGMEYAKMYADSQTEALDFVRKTVKKESIDCQLTDGTSFVYASERHDRQAVEAEYETAVKLGIDAQFIDNAEFPPGNCGMVAFKNQAVFHPVRYVDSLARAAVAKGAKIYCGTKAIKIEPGDVNVVFCENEIVILAKHVIMATQYPIYDGMHLFFTRLYAKRSYAVALSAKRDWPCGSYINVGKPTRSIRTHTEGGKKLLIVAGESGATGRGEENMQTHYDNLKTFAEEIAGIDLVYAKWSAQDYESPDQIPYIGSLSEHSGIHLASGFGKWGMTSGTLAGLMLSEQITGGSSRYDPLYSKSRGDYSSAPGKTVSEVLGSVAQLIRSKLEFSEPIHGLRPGEGRSIDFEGKKAGIYRDLDDNVSVIDITCTHMGTELKFNTAEKTWDCAAHGGRFNTDGKLLEGPPKNPLKVYYQGKYSELMGKE